MTPGQQLGDIALLLSGFGVAPAIYRSGSNPSIAQHIVLARQQDIREKLYDTLTCAERDCRVSLSSRRR